MAAVSGEVLVQPYLDYTGFDPAQGELKVKIWEYNSYMKDPYYRNPDMSDCQVIFCQEYVSREVAAVRFPDKINRVSTLQGSPSSSCNFYFLPENYNMARNDLLIISYIWYRSKKKVKRLYSKSRNQFFDYSIHSVPEVDILLRGIPDLEKVSVECSSWKVAVGLNDQLMHIGHNPLGEFDCPMVSYYWIYEPHIPYPEYRVRSLTRCMRSSQFLFNYKIIQNLDIQAATINAGWKRKVGAVANEDNLKKSGQGYDVIINDGYEMTDVDKIIPTAVPESDLALATQMADLVYKTSGFDMENWNGQEDGSISSLTKMMKQAAQLVVFQKFFDQWDFSDKLLGDKMLKILLNNWNYAKVSLILGSKPSAFFYSRIFAKYKIQVEEGLLTPTQRNMQAQSLLDINAAFGREVFPPSMVVKDMNIQGKAEAMKFLQQQEEQASQLQNEQTAIQHSFEDAKLKELYSRAVANIATARERHGRAEADIGLFEERLSEITRNRALATKDKMDALAKLIEVISKYGEIETSLKMNELESFDYHQESKEDREKADAKQSALANDFLISIMDKQGSPMGITSGPPV